VPACDLTRSELRERMDAAGGAAPHRGDTAQLAVVVLSVGAPLELTSAVASLRRQAPALELVVVNSGGGDATAVLAGQATDLRIITRQEVLLPGAARNLGIRATRAPFIAFLAADCLAADGWASARLERHLTGVPAVASALMPSRPRNLFAWASHLALFVRRLPDTPLAETLCYGASFARPLFDRYGLFREDLRIGEDTEFFARLPETLRPAWTAAVVTVHATPTTWRRMLRDQFERGQRTAAANPAGYRLRSIALLAIVRLAKSATLSLRSTRGARRWFSVASWPLLTCCDGAYAVGMAGERRRAARR
jgi:glycosyltransferase involved in cell wall biosynthesis